MTKTEALKNGAAIRKRFLDQIDRVINFSSSEGYPHCYIYSPPGIGKSYSIRKHLETSKVEYIDVKGNTSMFGFGIKLAVANFLNVNKQKLILLVDDCDSLFENENSCNIMKNVLDGVKKFNYEKSLQSQWTNLSELQKEALQHHQSDDKMGFEVPTDNMVFIFASNFQLPIDDDISNLRNRNNRSSSILIHKLAIRSRCNVGDYDLKTDELWGWLADVTLNTELLDCYSTSNENKLLILDFVWKNWHQLKERSLRLIKKMAEMMTSYPNDFEAYWSIDFKV